MANKKKNDVAPEAEQAEETVVTAEVEETEAPAEEVKTDNHEALAAAEETGMGVAEDSPVNCLRADFYHSESPSHRDFLGALMGAGIGRETVGDICVGKERCDFFVTEEIAPYIEQSFTSAGRTHVRISRIPLKEASIPEPEVKELRDTLASLRLDSVISSGFRIGRSLAAQYVTQGKAAIDGLPCEKPDKAVAEGAKISVRGLGKMKLVSVNGRTKKDRISVTIHRYV